MLKQEAGLRLDTADLIKKGTSDGPAIVIGNAHQSMLIEAVKGIGGRTRMPEEGDPLTAEEINLLSRWINEGAKAPDEPTPKIHVTIGHSGHQLERPFRPWRVIESH